MKLWELGKINLDDIYWNLVFGKSKKRGTILDLRIDDFERLPAPVFFLSPGRSGTKWFTDLLSHEKSLKAFHEPKPNMGMQGKLVYELYKLHGFEPGLEIQKLIKELFITGREQILRYSFKTSKRYLETNNQITFFAPALAELFPNAQFVHLNRHPGDFVRSAIRRSFYNNNIEDLKRIEPVANTPEAEKWQNFTNIEKNAWLWSETNAFIEEFKKSISKERIWYYNFSENTFEQLSELLEFLKIDIPETRIKTLIGNRKNIQKKGSFADYKNWSGHDKKELVQVCGNHAEKYGYKL